MIACPFEKAVMNHLSVERLHALDAVRAFALILGIVFHTTLSFLPSPTQWIVLDNDRSTALALLFFVLHMFRMTIFFLIAGFFGRLLLERRGTTDFALDRLKRIALPLVIGWPLLFGTIAAVAIWAAWIATDGDLSKAPRLPTDHSRGAFPLAHLWFLYLLLWMYVAALTVRTVVQRLDPRGRLCQFSDRALRALLESPTAAFVLAAPLAAMFFFGPPWTVWTGVPTPDKSLIPDLAAVIAYGLAFALGWGLQRQPELMQRWQKRWLSNLALALVGTLAALWLAGPASSVVEAPPPDWRRAAAAGFYTVTMWSWSFALIGLALRFLSDFSAWRRYAADASYWLYLIHLPLIMALQVAVARFPWPWWIKFPLILSVAFPLMLASYQLMVRHTWLGAVLNGRRVPRSPGALAGIPGITSSN